MGKSKWGRRKRRGGGGGGGGCRASGKLQEEAWEPWGQDCQQIGKEKQKGNMGRGKGNGQAEETAKQLVGYRKTSVHISRASSTGHRRCKTCL